MRTFCTLVLLAMLSGFSGCALSPSVKTAALPELSSELSLPSSVPADVQEYLLKVHKMIQQPWVVDVLFRSKMSFPVTHPANNSELAVDLEMAIQGDRSPGPVSIRKSSGYTPFDESALHVLGGVKTLPAPPSSLGEGHLFLRWTFYRDKRRCHPSHAQLRVVPYSPVEALTRALKHKEYQKAYAVMVKKGAPSTLKVVLLEDALSSGNLQQRRLAIHLATNERLVKLYLDDRHTALREKILEALVQRKAAVPLIALLDRVTTDKTLSPGVSTKRWLLALLAALEQAKITLPLAKLQVLLSDKRAAVVLAGAALASRPAALLKASEAWKNDPKMAGPLAVNRRALGEDKEAEQIIRAALVGPGAIPTLARMRRYPVQAVAGDVADVVRKGKQISARLEAIKVITVMKGPLSPLYAALRFKNPVLRIASIRALGKMGINKMGSSYRLVAIGLRERGPVSAESLAALATLGVEKFRGDVLRLMRLLKPHERVLIISALWGFGKPVLPALKKLQQSANKQISAAAVKSILRLSPARPPTEKSAAKATSLETLIRQALKS